MVTTDSMFGDQEMFKDERATGRIPVSIDSDTGKVSFSRKDTKPFVESCDVLRRTLNTIGQHDAAFLKKELAAIDLEIDHVHGADIDVDIRCDNEPNVLAFHMTDMNNMWKTYDGNEKITFVFRFNYVDGNTELVTNARTPFRYIPQDVRNRLARAISETFTKGNAICEKIKLRCDEILLECGRDEFHPNLAVEKREDSNP